MRLEGVRDMLASIRMTARDSHLRSTIVALVARHRFLRFALVGGTGACIGLGTTWFLTELIFGLERYFTAYLVGTAVTLIYNLTLYSYAVFGTTRNHARRLIVYLGYILMMIAIQASVVRIITPLIGLEWYLLVITAVVGTFAAFNFLVFKLAIFREGDS